jgi:glycosyltransferase involved in cell wall biosynthesis
VSDNAPLVSVICLCHNQKRFVLEALESVLQQTYTSIQLIVVDDGSTDGSKEVILDFTADKPAIQFIDLVENIGSCKAFNLGLKKAEGNFIIDLAADDVMVSTKVERQVNLFSTLDSSVGVLFSDATYINESGRFIRNHFEYLFRKKLIRAIAQGEVFREVLSTYFIPSPTMMIRKEVLMALNGYDETLAYEDFDFWVRSSRIFNYAYQDEKLMCIRKTNQSMSTGWYVRGDKQLYSTFLVCKKAQKLIRNVGDSQALVRRVRYELRQSIFSENKKEALLFYELLNEINGRRQLDVLYFLLNRIGLPLAPIRKLYHSIRFS